MALHTQRLVDLRTAKGWSQAETARQAGLNQSYYSSLERGKKNASGRTIAKLAKAHQVPAESLVA